MQARIGNIPRVDPLMLEPVRPVFRFDDHDYTVSPLEVVWCDEPAPGERVDVPAKFTYHQLDVSGYARTAEVGVDATGTDFDLRVAPPGNRRRDLGTAGVAAANEQDTHVMSIGPTDCSV